MCTLQKRNNIFTLTITGITDHRLNPTLISSIRSHLSEAKSQATPGSVLVTVAEGRFFSNGFDLAWAKKNSGGSGAEAINLLRHMAELFKDLVVDLVDFPMPTVAAVTGHAAAAGMLLAISHDYVIMKKDKAVFYMSEVDIGLTFPDYFTAVMRAKVAKPDVLRDVLMRAVKVKGDEALAKGLAYKVYDSVEEVIEASVRLGEEIGKRKWDGEVYSEIRKSLYPELIGILGLTTKELLKARL